MIFSWGEKVNYPDPNGQDTSKTRHLFMTDRMAQGNLKIDHCPTERIWVDKLTNILQGRPFLGFPSRNDELPSQL